MPKNLFADAILGVVKNGLDPKDWSGYFEAAGSLVSIDEAAARVLAEAGVPDLFSPVPSNASLATRVAWQARQTIELLRAEIECGQTPDAVRLALEVGALSVVLSALATEKDLKRGRKVIASAKEGGRKTAADKRRKNDQRDVEIVDSMDRLVSGKRMTPNSAATSLSKRCKLSARQILNVWNRSRSASTR
jgi:hypothetical protein